MPRPRNEDNEFKHVNDGVEGLKAAEARHIRELNTLADWNIEDPDFVGATLDPAIVRVERARYARQKRLEARVERLDRFIPDRKCPECGEFKPGLGQWVLSRGYKGKVVCRSCFFRLTIIPKLSRGEKLFGLTLYQWRSIFKQTGDETRAVLDTVQLERAIQLAGLTKASFSRRAGWTPAYTSFLTNPDKVKTVKVDTAEVVAQVLAEKGVDFQFRMIERAEILGDS